MNFRRDELTRTARAPAKLNLLLNVLGRREDGFHTVETLMVPVRLADNLSFRPIASSDLSSAGQIDLQLHSALSLQDSFGSESIPTGNQNLVVQALQLLQARSGTNLGAHVELIKRIPTAAGLGGASSDAAAALRLANRGWGIHWPDSKLSELAAEIGSDVPFFLHRSAAVCRGRGEQIEPLPPIAPLDFVIVKPPVALPTAAVYRAYDAVDPADNRRTESLADLAAERSWLLARRMRNALQQAASTLTPWIERLQVAFGALDFMGHQLTGSGSAYFGICRHAQHARRLANILRCQQLGLVYATRSYP